MKVRFALLTEGSSDAPLVHHLELLCVRAGADMATGHWVDFRQVPAPPGRKLADQLSWLKRHTSTYNMLFIHKDSDSGDDARARTLIATSTRESQISLIYVPVIPIQELEA